MKKCNHEKGYYERFSDRACVKSCLDIGDGKCDLCDPVCKECFGNKNNECLSC